MRIRLIAAGSRMPAWIDAGVEEYARRFGRGLKFELVEIPLAREAGRMRAAIGAGDHVVALEVAGRAMTTPQLAQWLAAAWPAARISRCSSAARTASTPACRRAPISGGRCRRSPGRTALCG